MLKIKKILFPTDFSNCADQAFAHAVYLARKHQAELHMLHAIVLYSPFESLSMNLGQIYDQLKYAAESVMAKAIETQQLGDIKVEKVLQPAISASSLIPDYAKEYDIDLIVIGTHGRRGLGHLLLGSVAEAVIRSAPCPVLAIRGLETPKPAGMIERILVPIDFSEYSKKALAYAKEMAELYGARLQLLHVIDKPPFPAFYTIDYLFSPTSLPDLEAESKKEFVKLIGEVGLSETSTDIHVINGKAARDIAKFAGEHKSDLIVISTHGLTGLEHLLMGSITEKVIRFAPCPVFTVKAFGKNLI